jgi:uncharacterized protein
MSQPAKMHEPTLEEILASIRRIIAEDDLRPPPPTPPPAKPAEAAPIPAAAIPAAPIPAASDSARDETADGFNDPQVSDVAANDVFDQRGSPWRPGEFTDDDSAAEEMRKPAVPHVDRDAPKPTAPFDHLRFAAAEPEPSLPEPAKDLPRREPLGPPTFEPFTSEVVKAELAKLELARSEFARAEAAKSDLAKPDALRSDHARPAPLKPDLPKFDLPKLDLPKFDMPQRDAPRWEASRPVTQEPRRPEPQAPAAPPPALRAADEQGLLSPRTTAAVDLAFNTLAQTVLVHNSRSLEDLVREMLKPMLRAWLDDNLPGLVERLVRAEIERVSRGRS